MKSAIFDGLRRWKDFSGRSDRRQFWWFYLFFLLTPLICLAISLALVSLLLLLNLDSLSMFSLAFAYLYLLLVPSMIAVQVRRMHDVGKSGWFILIPVYNFYLFVQPSLEKGRIPNWILAERVSLGFVGILVLSLFSGDFGTNLGGLVLWSLIYLAIRRRNQKQNPKDNSNPV
jgi:uncharacterized membrane protein YhaH (DUF805 family)